MSFRNTPSRTARSSEEPAACTMAFRFSMMRSACCAASPVSALPVVGSNAVWPDTNMNPLALMACEYGAMALGPFSVKINSLPSHRLLKAEDRNWKFEKRKWKNESSRAKSPARARRPPHFLFSLFHFNFLFFCSVTIAKILRHSRAIQPHAKRLGQILPCSFLDGRAQIVGVYFLSAPQRNP